MAEDFKEKESKEPTGNYIPKGKSGTLVTAYQVEDDYLSELLGIEGQIQYEKMERSDSQIRKLMHAVNNPIKSATWSIEPASDEEKDVKAAQLIEQILFKDLPEGFKAKLDEILDFPWRGHSVFEVVHKNITKAPFGSYTGLANLAWRDQKTLDEWHFSRDGILEKVHQKQDGDIPVNDYMEAQNLLIFFNEKKGNNLGFPFLRMLYGNYKRKLLYKQLQAIGIERAAIPVPHLELPDGVPHDSEEAENAEEQLAAFTQGESAYFMTPYGYKLNYNQTGTFDPSKVQTTIKAENEEIVGSLIGMWLEMGIGGNSGNQAGTGISAEFFRDGIEYLADKLKDKINLELIPNLCKLNFGELEVYPTLEHAGIADEAGKELMEVVTGYVEKGVITSDAQLEDHIRKVHNLPKKMEGEEVEQGGTTPEDKKEVEPPPPKNPDEEVEFSSKKKPKTPRQLMDLQADKVAKIIRDSLEFSSAKYINDVMARYNQLPEAKKQQATSKVKMGGSNKFKKDLKAMLTDTFVKAVEQAKAEIPEAKDVQLSSKPEDFTRLKLSKDEIKLNEKSKLPTHIQILLSKQSELIAEDSLEDVQNKVDFTFSGNETKIASAAVLKQLLEDAAEKFISSNTVEVKATNVVALMVNEGRGTFYEDDDVKDLIHSYTFVNHDPKSPICKELAGTTFKTNDAQSLRYSPPLHHNCKSYIRANLKNKRGVEKLEVSKLAPSAEAQKSITL